jgi:indolepyruvate ferredoxin oxidoreductase beta subunit
MSTVEDPLNLIICGVGGQGNVVASRLIGRALVRQQYHVTVGETYGAAQRGGAVMSHLRASGRRSYGPFIPKGKAHIVLSLEPMETIRLLGEYGNPGVVTVTNSHPVFPVGVLMGREEYPDPEELKNAIRELSQLALFVDATQKSVELGVPVVANVIMIGALIAIKQIPLTAQHIQEVIRDSLPPDKAELSMKALEIGLDSAKGWADRPLGQ